MTQWSRPWANTTPGDAGPYSDTQWAEIYAALAGSLIGPATKTARGVLEAGLSEGLRVIERSAGANMSVDVNAGAALVNGRLFASTTTENLAITAADPSLNRYDYVVARSDAASQVIRLAVITGTPAASPAIPTLDTTGSPYFELPLAVVYIAAGVTTITQVNILDARAQALAAQRVMVEAINRDAGVLTPGDVVVWSGAANTAVAKTTTANNVNVAGVVMDRVEPWHTVRICTQGVVRVKRSGGVALGSYLSTAAAAGAAAIGTSAIFARALSPSVATDGLVWAYVNVLPQYVAPIPAPAFGQVVRAGTLSTSSSSFVDVDTPTVTITLTTSGRDVEVAFNTSVYAGSASTACFDFTVDGTRLTTRMGVTAAYGIAMTRMSGAGIDQCVASGPVRVTGLSAGSHTFRVQWKNLSGTTMYIHADTTIAFYAREVQQ